MAFLSGRAFWGVSFEDGRWYTQLHRLVDLARATERELQWYDDVVASGDHRRIRDLWLFSPRSLKSPMGATCHLTIEREKGHQAFCVFGAACNLGTGYRYPTYTLIGCVTHPGTGATECYVWDALVKQTYHYRPNITDMCQWREGGPLIGKLALDRIGLSLPDLDVPATL